MLIGLSIRGHVHWRHLEEQDMDRPADMELNKGEYAVKTSGRIGRF